jgi:hypothetical protein
MVCENANYRAAAQLAQENPHIPGGLTLREIIRVLHISESTACLRHRALLAKLPQMGRTSLTKQEGVSPW